MAVPVTAPAQKAKLPLPLLIAIGAGGLLLVLLIALLILSRQHLKASEEERQALLEQIPDGGAITENSQNAIAADNKTKNDGNISLLTEEEQSALQGQDDELKKNEEILNLKMQHSLKLKQEIVPLWMKIRRSGSKTDPELAAYWWRKRWQNRGK